jgi:hypothetical protein
MAEQREAGVVAAGQDAVRGYLRKQGMTDSDISKFMDQARTGPGPAQFSFGPDDAGLVPRYTLRYEGESFVLAEQQV